MVPKSRSFNSNLRRKVVMERLKKILPNQDKDTIDSIIDSIIDTMTIVGAKESVTLKEQKLEDLGTVLKLLIALRDTP